MKDRNILCECMVQKTGKKHVIYVMEFRNRQYSISFTFSFAETKGYFFFVCIPHSYYLCSVGVFHPISLYLIYYTLLLFLVENGSNRSCANDFIYCNVNVETLGSNVIATWWRLNHILFVYISWGVRRRPAIVILMEICVTSVKIKIVQCSERAS